MYDEESGFYYLRSRYYDPYVGRFLNADTLVATGQGFDGNNMFAYCGNNPVMFKDPNSNCPATYEHIRNCNAGIETCDINHNALHSLISLRKDKLSDEINALVSVVAGEAGFKHNTLQERQAVAHTIMNRLHEPRDFWSGAQSIFEILVPSQYNAVGGNNYNACLTYLNNRDGSNHYYEEMIYQIINIYYGWDEDFTGGAHYIFNANKSQYLLSLLMSQPDRYTECGPFESVDSDLFRMYRCEY